VKALAPIVAFLSAAAPAWGQSLLGGDGGSPYDPPPAPVFRKHDRLLVRLPGAGADAVSEALAGRRSPGRLGLEEWSRIEGAAAERPARAPEPATGGRPAPAAEGSRTIAVEVADVRPNGVLVVQAVRRRRVNGVEETLRLAGEVSPRDVAAGEVALDRVANLSVAYDGGAARLPGWISGLFGKVWPF